MRSLLTGSQFRKAVGKDAFILQSGSLLPPQIPSGSPVKRGGGEHHCPKSEIGVRFNIKIKIADRKSGDWRGKDFVGENVLLNVCVYSTHVNRNNIC